jgi:hypothetical protein
MSVHVDVQNAILAALTAHCQGAYTLGSPKASWDGEARVLHLTAADPDQIRAVVAGCDALGCEVEVAGPKAEIQTEEPAAPSTKRGGRKKSA